jgi:hypothetical protein
LIATVRTAPYAQRRVRISIMGVMRLADTHPEPGFPILPVRSGIDPSTPFRCFSPMRNTGHSDGRRGQREPSPSVQRSFDDVAQPGDTNP